MIASRISGLRVTSLAGVGEVCQDRIIMRCSSRSLFVLVTSWPYHGFTACWVVHVCTNVTWNIIREKDDEGDGDGEEVYEKGTGSHSPLSFAASTAGAPG